MKLSSKKFAIFVETLHFCKIPQTLSKIGKFCQTSQILIANNTKFGKN